MSNKKQTAIEWLIEQIRSEKYIEDIDLEQAKEMEKEQIMDAYNYGCKDDYVIGAEQYYKETFKSE